VKYYTICLVSRYLGEAVVIGGGIVAARKVESLLAAGAQVKVISPELTPDLQLIVTSGKLNYIPRAYQNGDLEGAVLVIAATNDPSVNQSVWREAMQRGCLINTVDDPQHCNFILPAVVQRGDLSIAISTGGSSPALARRLRERIEELIGPEYGLLAEVLAELRPGLIAAYPDGESRLQAVYHLIDSGIIDILQTQGKEAALIYGREKLH
jgi:precorrin-2 dehydrogenase/sirohydrochlorin ferrochelatase